MIPVTIFAGRNVAVLGLGLSGLAAARSLTAGGAEVFAWDDKAKGQDAAAAEGFTVTDLATADWSRFAALVLAPGIPLTHPEPHWSVVKARASRRRSDRRHRALLPRAGAGCDARQGRGHHRHQRQIDHHRAHGPSLRTQASAWPLGGNIGKSVLDLEPFAPDLIYVIELSSFQIDLSPSLKPDAAALLNITPDHLDRHGTLARLCPHQGADLCEVGTRRDRGDRHRRRAFPRHRRCPFRPRRGQAHRRRAPRGDGRLGQGWRPA